ncbi:MAG: 50S ribosomal protein L25/general stress protein Ctc [Bauldia sp.]|nr:50S ribosomal protein L25/general stress protein Ctc [Bauldia sp.]MCW5718957.1 50S ribosomal protein L25/general stress protein Ctc [Bauldia sp.]
MGTPYELTASVRDKSGTGSARAVRREGLIPGIVYGGDEAPVSIKLSYRDLHLKLLGGGFMTTVVTLDIDGNKVRAIPRDYQLDPVRDRPLHVDFLRVTKDSLVTVDVPVHFINEAASPGIKRGGVLNVVRHTVEVLCPVDAIPNEFVADLTGLEIGDSLHISKVALPENVRPTIRDRDFTIATIAAPAGAKDAEADAAAAAAASAASTAATEAARNEGKS